MRLLSSAALLLLAGSAAAFAPAAPVCRHPASPVALAMAEAATASADSTMADAGKPPAHAESDVNVADVEIPTTLPSDVGMDYVPLATMLATGQLAEADQVRMKERKRQRERRIVKRGHRKQRRKDGGLLRLQFEMHIL